MTIVMIVRSRPNITIVYILAELDKREEFNLVNDHPRFLKMALALIHLEKRVNRKRYIEVLNIIVDCCYKKHQRRLGPIYFDFDLDVSNVNFSEELELFSEFF